MSPYKFILIFLSLLYAPYIKAQIQLPSQVPTSVDAKMVLDAAGPKQRNALSALMLVVCPVDSSAGTGFLLKSGTVVTNAHVVGKCTRDNLFAILNDNTKISFCTVVPDARRDLALLLPSKKMPANGLALHEANDLLPGEIVSTWGYPLLYNGTTPLLSVGYLAGFRDAEDGRGGSVKHLVVNAAFNHGNSGGPLLRATDNEVVGVVVITYHFHPSSTRNIIDSLAQQESGMTYIYKDTNGTQRTVTEAQLTAAVLDDFFKTTQVMIGEAISVAELKQSLEHASTLK